MLASKDSRSMFISDPGDRCLWRVQMPGGGISRWEMDGTHGESVDHFIGWVDRCCSTWGSMLSGHLQLFGCHQDTVDPSADWNRWTYGTQFSRRMEILSSFIRPRTSPMCIRSVNCRSMEGTSSGLSILDRFSRWISRIGNPEHLSFDDDEHLFVVDYRHERVYLLSSQLTDPQILLKTDSTSTPWTAETLLRTREATVDRWSGRTDRRTRSCLCVQCSSTTTSDEHRTWTRTERWTITTWLTPDRDTTNSRVRDD